MNESKESVFKKLLNKEIPVLSLFGAATGAGLMSGGEDQPQLARGGFLDNSESEKGIMSIEGQSMADEKFRLDRAKADLNNDGKLSSYEQARGEAVQKAIKDDKPMKAYHGGMPCGCEGDCDGSCGGEGMMPGSYYDTEEETGNPVPVGSLPEEVADDISAFLSEGEYVLPSDVVRWHGLKHIQDMMVEAKAGLMSMDMMGQLHDTEGTGEEYEEEEEQGEEEYETPEGNDVEVATVETEEEVLDEDEDEEAKTVSYAFKSTPKVAFIR
jgi:Arc/MetJ-type ribon-helix-helix transcriptional regulator